jgi:hypothetical protein
MNWVLFRFKLVNTRLQRYLVRAHIESRACWTPGPERPWPVRARRLEFVAFMEENRTWFTISKTILDMLTMDERVKSFLLERVPAEVQYLKKKKKLASAVLNNFLVLAPGGQILSLFICRKEEAEFPYFTVLHFSVQCCSRCQFVVCRPLRTSCFLFCFQWSVKLEKTVLKLLPSLINLASFSTEIFFSRNLVWVSE